MRKGGNPPQSALRLRVGLPAFGYARQNLRFAVLWLAKQAIHPAVLGGGAKVGALRSHIPVTKADGSANISAPPHCGGAVAVVLCGTVTEGDCRMGAYMVSGTASLGARALVRYLS